MESQQNALDEEAQAYEEAMNRFVENLRTNLDSAFENMDSFLAGVSASVMVNASIVKDEYVKTGATLDDAIVKPWDAAIEAIGTYETNGLSQMNAWTTDGGFFGQFSEGAKDKLTGFWGDGIKACDGFEESISTTLSDISTNIETNVAKWREDVKSAYADIQDDATNPPKLQGQGTPNNTPTTSNAKTLHDAGAVTATWYQVGNAEDMLKNSIDINGVKYYKAPDGYYYKFSERKARKDVHGNPGYAYPKGTKRYSYYAKGTLGTKQNELAIVDEFGPELIMHADPTTGRLQYLTKGSSVVPSEISANLVEWGKLNPNMMQTGGGANLNMISNAVTKPEFNLSFEALVKADKIDQDTLPEVKKFVQQEINSLVKQMNYAIKKFK